MKKFASTHERIGAARLRLDAEATAKFHQPFSTTLNPLILHAMKARRNVHAVRLNYDAARAKLKNASASR